MMGIAQAHAGDKNWKLIGIGGGIALIGVIFVSGGNEGLGGPIIVIGVAIALVGLIKTRKRCPNCRAKISPKAKVCPQCQQGTMWG